MLFGGKIPVVAPRHFVFVGPILKTRNKKVVGFLGSIEYLCYSNEVTSPTPLKRAEIVAALRAKSFPQYNHTNSAPSLIPDLWNTWVPEKAKDLTEGKHPIKYKVSLGRTIEKLSEHSARAQFRYFPLTVTEPIANPPANVKTKAGFKLELSKQPKHQPGWGPTGFPVYEQLGHKTFDEFFDSFTWTSPKNKNADPFTWVGTRHEYNVLLPVVEPPMTGKKTDRLIYNFFPPRGTGGTTFVELDETEPGLFYTSPGAP
jgi:hypothetical protein